MGHRLLDERIQKNILKFLYENWKNDPFRPIEIGKLLDRGDIGIDEKILYANADYLVEKGLIERPRTMRYLTKLTVYGINEIENQRTTPDFNTRIQILNVLKDKYEKDPKKSINRGNLIKILNLPDVEILRNVLYLSEMGYIDVRWTLGANFYAKISADGLDYLNQPTKLEKEKKVMSYAYSLLYELENELRHFYEMTLKREYEENWWEEGVSAKIRDKAQANKDRENGEFSIIYYTDFEDLRLVPHRRWKLFENIFKTQGGILARLGELEPIRHKIAHSRLLTDDEITKLELFHKEILNMLRAGDK